MSALEHAMADLLQETLEDARDPRGGGRVSPAAYDTAWVARVPDPHDPTRPAFPDALPALLALQEPNGAFGRPFPHDLVPSLGAAACLATVPWAGPRETEALARVVAYLREALPRWDVASFEAIAFELVVPHLLRELADAGIHFDVPGVEKLLALSAHKLQMLDPEALYGAPSTLVYALEGLAGRLDPHRCAGLQRHGGFGASPAATAAMVLRGFDDPASLAWLQRVSRDGAAPVVWPIDLFELSWATCDFLRADPGLRTRLDRFTWATIAELLEQATSEAGSKTSAAATWPPNSDDTAANLAARLYLGLEPDVDVLLQWFEGTHFRTWERERNASLSTNAHVLETLAIAPPTPARREAADATGRFLVEQQAGDGSWTDKWHVSPYYATACAVHALRAWDGPGAREAVQRAVSWVRASWRPESGGWGLFDATSEETAYAVAVLEGTRSPVQLAAARTFLDGPHRPADLWLSKQLYTPERVVRSTVLAARHSLREVGRVAA